MTTPIESDTLEGVGGSGGKAAGQPLRECLSRLVSALAKVSPIETNNTPDYAELTFGEHKTKAMTMVPQDWNDIEAAYLDAQSALSATFTDAAVEAFKAGFSAGIDWGQMDRYMRGRETEAERIQAAWDEYAAPLAGEPRLCPGLVTTTRELLKSAIETYEGEWGRSPHDNHWTRRMRDDLARAHTGPAS